VSLPYVTMPRTYKRVLGSRPYAPYSQTKVVEALAELASGRLTQRQASIQYGIPRSTLKNKLKGRHSKPHGGQTVLSAEEEDSFCQYAVAMSTFGFPVDTFDLRCIVKSYLDRRGCVVPKFRNNMPGKEWTVSFLKRHPELSVRFASNIKRKRAQISDITITDYFTHLEPELTNVPPSNIWNYDETNLTDDPGNRRVITKRGAKYPERVINSTKTATSLMFCGNAEGEVIPPYVVYKAESMWTTWTENGPTGARYNRSKSGWFDALCFEDWFRSLLLPRLKKSHPGKNVVIGDNLSSHINLNVLELCKQNNVCFVSLPPNSTHLTQPLDVAYFRPMKMAWRKILTDWKTKGKGRKAPSLPKDEFPKLLKTLMQKLNDNGRDSLVSGFCKTGIYPLDKQQVLARLPNQAVAEGGDGLEAVSESFLEHLKEARGDGESSVRRKRQKVSVTPGKSVSVDDVQQALSSGKAAAVVSGKSKKRALTASNSTGANDNIPPVTQHPVTVNDAQLSAMIDEDEIEQNMSLDSECDSDVEPNGDDDSSEDDESLSLPASGDESTGGTDAADDSEPRNVAQTQLKKTLEVGDYIIVDYEGAKYPGVVAVVKKAGAEVSVMTKSGVNWRWPQKIDQIYYSLKEVMRVISEPIKLNARGTYKVPEMNEFC